MCGIVGLIHARSKVDATMVEAAARTLRERGPDDSGVWAADHVAFGHQRLAIIDLTSSGHQPMLSADGRYVIVFNGEIYNFMELRRDLDANEARWRSKSDTEVVLAAYREWGPRCVERFHGMFAFAIWDTEDKVLFAARDRMGVKPFYYHFSSECFAFASRPRALLALDRRWASPLDEQALRFYLESGYVPAPYSIYQAIRKLRPGHWLLLRDNNLRVEQYWDFRQIEPETAWEERREDDLLDELDAIVCRSVRSRMISDVPLGAFLSGGIDSSLVVGAMAKYSSQPVKTFTIGFAERAFDESEHAGAVAEHLKTEHHCERLKVDDLLELMPTFSRHYDEPLYDSSAFPTMAVSRLARRHVTVSLSGDGGDELFGGYPYYQIVRGLSAAYKLPVPLRRSLASLVGIAPQHRLKLLAGALRERNVADAYSFSRSISKDFENMLVPDLVRRTVGMRELMADAAKAFPSGLSAPEMGMRLDAYYTLADDYLQKVDVASMAFSLESRDPLLDHELVEWAMRLPLKWKLRGTRSKYLLRKLAERYVPRRVLERPKQGFSVPIDEWLRGPLHPWAARQLSNTTTFERLALDHAAVSRLFALHNSGARNAHNLLWAILMLVDFDG
jgi:asparagine synthase (glutamine-hydrolysing)